MFDNGATMSTPPRPEELSHDDLEAMLIVELADHEWHDFTEDCPDAEAVQCLATGYKGKRNGDTLFMLTRYDDEGDAHALISSTEQRPEGRCVSKDQTKLAWLWEKVAPIEEG